MNLKLLTILSFSSVLYSTSLFAEKEVKQPSLVKENAKAEQEIQESPVEKTLRQILTTIFNEMPKEQAPPQEIREEILHGFIKEFRKQAPKWTKKDAALLKANKPLVSHFEKTIAAYEVLAKYEANEGIDQLLKIYKKKEVTELEKRALTDLLHFINAQAGKNKSVSAINNSKDIYIAIRDYAISEPKGLGKAGDKKTPMKSYTSFLQKGMLKMKNLFI